MSNSIEDILAQFNNKIRLSQFLSKYLELTPRGDSFIARCPFHNEKTPSFSINDEKGLFHCFGCGVGGNVFTFVAKYKNFTFRESLEFVADLLGVKLTSYEKNSNPTIQRKKKKLKNLVKEYFKNNLLENLNAISYLKNREIDESFISKFEIGYCLPNHESLIQSFQKYDYSIEDLIDIGLLIQSKKDKKSYFGRFSDRIIFPIYNFANQVVGFGGRTLSNSKIKYINSPENTLFKKSENLYGFKQNFEDIRRLKDIILVEGYLDVISLNTHGVSTSVASLGTSFSEIQINKIWNFADTPHICFDGDLAGRNAMQSFALKILKFLKPGKSFKFMVLPNNMDPDSYIRINKKDSFDSLKKKSIALSSFIWSIINSEKNATPEYVALMDEKINNIVKVIDNKNVSVEYLRYLKGEKNKFLWDLRRYKKDIKSENKQNLINNKVSTNEIVMLSFLAFEPNIIENFVEELVNIKFANSDLNLKKEYLVNYIISSEKHTQKKDKHPMLDDIDEKFLNILTKAKNDHFLNLTNNEKEILIRNIILNLKLPDLIRDRDEIKLQISKLEKKDDIFKLIEKHEKISNEINMIKKKEI